MTLRDVLRKKESLANAPSHPPIPSTPASPTSSSHAGDARTSSSSTHTADSTSTPIPDFVFVRTDTQSEEIIAPPDFPDDGAPLPGPNDAVNLAAPRPSRGRRLSNLLRGKSPSPAPSASSSTTNVPSTSSTQAHDAAAARGAHNAQALGSLAGLSAETEPDPPSAAEQTVGKLEKRLSSMLHLKRGSANDDGTGSGESERDRRRRSAREPSPANAPSDLGAAPPPVRLGKDELEDEARWERRATLLVEGSARSRSVSASGRSEESASPAPFPVAAETGALGPASPASPTTARPVSGGVPTRMATGIGSPPSTATGETANEGGATERGGRLGVTRTISDADGDVSAALHSNPVVSL